MNNSKIFTHILCIIFLSILIQNKIIAQNKFDLIQFKEESIKFIKQPTNWEKNDILKLGIITASTLLVMQADQSIRDEYLKDRKYVKSFPIEFGRQWGEIYTTVILGGLFGLHGLAKDDKSTRRIGFEIFQTAFYSGIITQFFKISIGRARPFTNNGSNFYKPFTLFNDDYHSLPSGHTTLAFALSTVLSKNSDSDFLKIIAYMPAILTAVSRVYQDNHWTSDILLGAAIGYFVGDWVHSIHNSETKNTNLLQKESIGNLEIHASGNSSQNYQWVSIKIVF